MALTVWLVCDFGWDLGDSHDVDSIWATEAEANARKEAAIAESNGDPEWTAYLRDRIEVRPYEVGTLWDY